MNVFFFVKIIRSKNVKFSKVIFLFFTHQSNYLNYGIVTRVSFLPIDVEEIDVVALLIVNVFIYVFLVKIFEIYL